PLREILLPIAPARPGLVFLGEMWVQRTVPRRADGGRERMVVRLRVVADDLHLFLDEPLPRRWHEARRAAEIILVVLVSLVPTGIDYNHVPRAHRGAGGLFQIVVRDRFPLLLRNGHHDARAEGVWQRILLDDGSALVDVRRRISMRC